MDDHTRAALKAASSEDWQHDAVTLAEVGNQAGAAMALAAMHPGSSECAEQDALFRTAYAEAHLNGLLAIAAAVRELTAELNDFRRMMP